MKNICLVTVAALLSGCAAVDRQSGSGAAHSSGARDAAFSIARGPVRLADGAHAGEAMVHEARDGRLTLSLALTRYAPGTYGVHVHSVGRCEGTDFATAGPHWNPGTRQHGRLNPAGTHQGDLPNLVVPPSGVVHFQQPFSGAARGTGGLLDGDGASVVIHAAPDDERTDPSGNSGARIACAVLTPR